MNSAIVTKTMNPAAENRAQIAPRADARSSTLKIPRARAIHRTSVKIPAKLVPLPHNPTYTRGRAEAMEKAPLTTTATQHAKVA